MVRVYIYRYYYYYSIFYYRNYIFLNVYITMHVVQELLKNDKEMFPHLQY